MSKETRDKAKHGSPLLELSDGWRLDLSRSQGGFGSGAWVSREVVGGWWLALHVRPHFEGMSIAAIELRPGDETTLFDVSGALSLLVERGPIDFERANVNLGAQRRSADAAIYELLRTGGGGAAVATLMGFAHSERQPRRRGRRPRDEADLRVEQAVIAAAYAAAVSESRRPYKEMRTLLGRSGIVLAPNTLRHRVHRARHVDGFLDDAPGDGRAGGRLTDTARQVLIEAGFAADLFDPNAEEV